MTTPEKNYKLTKDDIQPLAPGFGGCLATDMITVEGHPVNFMYREEQAFPDDSGWRFLSGFESDEYMDDTDNHGIYAVNTIANYDPDIIPLLLSPIGAVFERPDGSGKFEAVEGWAPPDD